MEIYISNTDHMKKPAWSAKKIPISISYFFLTLMFVFGFNFGFTKVLKKRLRPVAQVFCVLVAFTSMILIVTSNWNPNLKRDMQSAWYSMLFSLQYTAYVILLCCVKYNIYDLIKDINDVNENILAYCSNKYGNKILLSTSLFFLLKVILCAGRCAINVDCEKAGIIDTLRCTALIGLDVISVTTTLVFFYLYSCIEYLNDSFNASRANVIDITKQYIKVCDSFDKIRPAYDGLILIEILASFPKLMTMLLGYLAIIRDNFQWYIYVGTAVFLFQIITQILIPSVTVELTYAKIDDFKTSLHNKLVLETDEQRCADMVRLLRYVEARQFRHRVCRVFPVDVHLPLSMFNLCITYIIVIVQFTQK